MKRILLLSAIFFSIANVHAQDSSKVVSDAALMKMNIFDFCKAVGVPSDYNKRYEAVILPLCDAGKMLFDKKSNPYVSGSSIADTMKIDGRSADCYLYIGTGPQNETLKRNILANRQLLVKGKVTPQNAKKWKVVK